MIFLRRPKVNIRFLAGQGWFLFRALRQFFKLESFDNLLRVFKELRLIFKIACYRQNWVKHLFWVETLIKEVNDGSLNRRLCEAEKYYCCWILTIPWRAKRELHHKPFSWCLVIMYLSLGLTCQIFLTIEKPKFDYKLVIFYFSSSPNETWHKWRRNLKRSTPS